MKNPLAPTARRVRRTRRSHRDGEHALAGRRRVTGATAALACLVLVACTTGSAGSLLGAADDSQTHQSAGTVWTTMSSSTREASIGATPGEVLAANADTSQAVTAPSQDAVSGSWDASTATTITLSSGSIDVEGADARAVSVSGTTATITGGGTFVISGTLDDGQIVVSAPDADVDLVLNGATISNDDGPAIDIQDAGSAVVVLAEGSRNTLADGAVYADTGEDAATAALFSSDTLTVTGTGSLEVTGSSNDAISSDNGLAITGSPVISADAVDDGLRGKDYLVVSGGTLVVTAGGDGLKASEDNDDTKGFVSLGQAQVTITSGDDGIAATTDVTVEGTTLTIASGGGQANATAQEQQAPGGAQTQDSSTQTTESPKGVNAGVAYSQDSGTVTIDAADEGLQAAFPTVTGGELTVLSGDDGINASNGDYTIEGYENADSESDDGSYLTISGGTVQIDYAGSDGIDSNGSAAVTAGRVLVSGQAGSMDGSVDVNGEAELVGITGAATVGAGDTVSVTSSDEGTGWELTSAITADAITVLGLTEGGQYSVTSTSGASISATASALSSGTGGGPGAPA